MALRGLRAMHKIDDVSVIAERNCADIHLIGVYGNVRDTKALGVKLPHPT